jgi:hypothetical protein
VQAAAAAAAAAAAHGPLGQPAALVVTAAAILAGISLTEPLGSLTSGDTATTMQRVSQLLSGLPASHSKLMAIENFTIAVSVRQKQSVTTVGTAD